MSPDWTIDELLEWLSDDDRLDDPLGSEAHAALARIEAAASRLLGASPCTGRTSGVALVRSIASLCTESPMLRSLELRTLLRTDEGAADQETGGRAPRYGPWLPTSRQLMRTACSVTS